jgi:hypothetical protein
MKMPKYVLLSMQDCIDVGLNAFALELIAESFADKPEKFGADNLVVRLEAHNHQEVWMVLTKTAIQPQDFTDAGATTHGERPETTETETKGGVANE